jgi:stress response protein YsnF
MLTDRELAAAIGSAAYGTDGDKIGTVEHFFVDDRSGAPTWVAVSTGLLGTRSSIVPAVDAAFADGMLRLPVTRDAVRHAPAVSGDQHLDPAEEERLRAHYGLAGEGGAPAAAPSVPATPTAADPSTPSGGAMTRSEEQLRVRTEQIAATRVRLVKYVVTEEVQVTVPVRREEIRIEEVPLDAPEPGPEEFLVDEGPRSAPAAGSAGLPDEIVLHREEPVVSVRVVPVERVRLRTDVVEGQVTVGDRVQRERIVVDEDRVPPVR